MAWVANQALAAILVMYFWFAFYYFFTFIIYLIFWQNLKLYYIAKLYSTSDLAIVAITNGNGVILRFVLRRNVVQLNRDVNINACIILFTHVVRLQLGESV